MRHYYQWSVLAHVASIYVNSLEQKKVLSLRKELNSHKNCLELNMAASLLFRNTNMASVISFERSITHAISILKYWSHAQCVSIEPVQSHPVNTDTEEAILGVRIKRVEFRENVGAFFPQGQSKLSVITRCPY